MKTITRTVIAALLLAALALPLAAQTSGNASTYDASGAYWLLHHPRALAKFLGLSQSQTKTLLDLWNTLQQTVQPLRQARDPLCAQLAVDLAVNPPNPPTVGGDTISLYDNRQAIIAANEAFDTAFSAILTPAQLIAYDTLKQIAHSVDPDYTVLGDCPR